MQLADQAEIVIVISAGDIEKNKVRGDLGITYDTDDLSLVCQLHEHPQLTVRLKSRQDSGSVEVVKELPAEFQVELIVKLVNPLPDMLGLRFQVFLIIKSDFHILRTFPCISRHVLQIIKSILHL